MELALVDELQPAKRIRTTEPLLSSPSVGATIRSSLIDDYYLQFSNNEEFPGLTVENFDKLNQFHGLDSFPAQGEPADHTEIPEMKFNRDSGYEAGRLISLTLRLKTEPLELQLSPVTDPDKGKF